MPEAPHQARQVAEGFGAQADRYDRARPRYPAALIERLAVPGERVLDVGCGTGIATRQFEAAGCQVLGVDPDPRMIEGLNAEVARFEDWDPRGRRFDTVISAQSWHWIDPVRGAAKAAQVLRPGGRIALFWNVFQPAPELAAAFARVFEGVAHGLPFKPWAGEPLDAYNAILGRAAAGLQAGFEPPERWRHDWAHTYTREEWLEQVPTHGGFSVLAPAHAEAILEGLAAVLDDTFVMGYATVALIATRSAPVPATG